MSDAGADAAQAWRSCVLDVDATWRRRQDGAPRPIGGLPAAESLSTSAIPPIAEQADSWHTHISAVPVSVPLDEVHPLACGWLLVSVALDYEQWMPLSLPLASLLGSLPMEPSALTDLPVVTGVSKLGVGDGISLLQRAGMVDVETVARRRTVSLTARGRATRERHFEAVVAAEDGFLSTIDNADDVRHLFDERAGDPALLRDTYRGTTAGWRAGIPMPARLPAYPIISVRGGYPDGA